MRLPFEPPVQPMLSTPAASLPSGTGWQFEPKWDGFRTLVFRDGADIMLQSRDEKPMNRYFPELLPPLLAMLPERCVVDGEVVIVGKRGLNYEALLLRIHAAASRVKLLAEQTPAGTSWRWATRICARRRWPTAARASSARSRARGPRFISRPRRATGRSRRIGSGASKARGWTA